MTGSSPTESKQSLARGLAAAGVAFGLTGLLAPRVMEAAYAVPHSPHSRQLLRLFSSRNLTLGLWGLTTRTEEELDRALALTGAMSLVDAATALGARSGTSTRNAVAGAATSAFFGAAALVIRARKR
jgi:hypothetical protein